MLFGALERQKKAKKVGKLTVLVGVELVSVWSIRKTKKAKKVGKLTVLVGVELVAVWSIRKTKEGKEGRQTYSISRCRISCCLEH